MSAKILLVEDDIFLRDGIKEALKKEGYSVFTAEDCKTGKAEFVKENPELQRGEAPCPRSHSSLAAELGFELDRRQR